MRQKKRGKYRSDGEQYRKKVDFFVHNAKSPPRAERLVGALVQTHHSCSGITLDRRPDSSFEITVAAQWRNCTSLPRSNVEAHCIPAVHVRKVDNALQDCYAQSQRCYRRQMMGMFDSGSGGLSVLSALRARAPLADIVYFGDIAHAPYGIRNSQQLRTLTQTGVAILKGMGATEVLSACNSVSPSILAGAAGDMPVIEMTRPTAHGMEAHRGTRVLLIATPATVDSSIYQDALSDILQLDALPIAELAGSIEFDAPQQEVARILQDAFAQRTANHYDALLLGCTHYPLVRDLIETEAEKAFGTIEVIDPAAFVADQTVHTFQTNGTGSLAFKISQDSEPFRRRVEALFAGSYSLEVGV